MNIHPIFVHFPVAFLTIYSIAELLRYRNFEVKRVLIIVGWAGSIVAALTGLVTTDWTISGPRIFILHEIFAVVTIVLSTISATLYMKKIEHKALIYLSLLILISIVITGGLGGAMVFGSKADPFMAPILKLLGVY